MATFDGTALAETLNGTSDPDTLRGLGGEDILNGLGGNDRLIGGTGIDHLFGGTGNDRYHVDDADILTENAGEGVDTVISTITWSLGSNFERLTLAGWANTDGMGNPLDNLLIGNGGNNVLSGGLGQDVLYGMAGNDMLQGGDGNDRLIGGAGADSMSGGSGNDIYFVDNPGDTITEVGGGGSDTVRSSISYVLGAGLEGLVATDPSGTAPLALTGNDAANRIVGNAGANVIDGGAGADRLYGGAGNDYLSGGWGRDLIHGGEGNDFIYSTQFTGNDTLYGEAGADIFHFDTFTSAQVNGYVPTTSASIMDFQTGVDTIDLHLFGISTNDDQLYWVEAGAFTGLNRIEASFANGVLQIDYNGDQIADLILNVSGTIAASDFTFTFDPWGY